MPTRRVATGTRSTPQWLGFSEPPLRGFVIHLCVYVFVIAGLAALNLAKNPSHPWFLWVLIAWGIALAMHDVILLIKSQEHAHKPREELRSMARKTNEQA
jgi:hypothetical protein